MSPTVLDSCLRWGGAERGETFSRTLELQTWAGERVDVVVDRDEAALVLEGDAVVAVLMSGQHAVQVLRNGEDRGDVSRRELAGRMRVDLEDVPSLQRRLRWLKASQRLVFVTTGPLGVLSIGEDETIPFHDSERGEVALELEGAVRLAVWDPVRFYDSFLRKCEDLRDDDFARIVGTLVEAGLGRAFEETFGAVDRIDPDLDILGDLGRRVLDGHLGGLGLAVAELEITRLRWPTVDRRIAPTPASTLATSVPHR